MPAKQFTAFISYAHSDGEELAKKLQEKINAHPRGKDITFWQDHSQMKYGQWSKQIEDAINNVEFLIMLITPGALDSINCKDEWMYARKKGVAVLPVNGAPDDPEFYNIFPNWLKKQHIYHPEKNWERFINDLNSNPETPKVPFMAPRLSEISNYVQRKEILSKLKQLLQNANEPVAITTALQGSGGFGKTTLAVALCNDDDIVSAFDDGILWVTLGQQKGSALTAMQKLFDAVSNDKQNFIDLEQAQQQLKEKLYGKNYLLVLDDVWHRVDAEAILSACGSITVLITTRMDKVLLNSQQEHVDEMTNDEAIQQLSSYTGPADIVHEKLGKLAEKLGYWALLLKLAGAQLKARIDEGESIEQAITFVSKRLERKGLSGFDRFDAEQRNDSVQLCLAASIELLEKNEKEKLYSLGIFSEYGSIPFAIIEKYWGLDDFDCEELLEKFHRLGIVDLDLTTRTVTIHDILLRYYNSCLENLPAQHALLMKQMGSFENWKHKYAWEWGIWHLIQAKEDEVVIKLLSNYRWIEGKYKATGSLYEVTKDYDHKPENEELRLIQIALLLSAPTVTSDPTQLPHQLYGRLGSMKNILCREVAMQSLDVINRKEVSIKPLHPNLEIPDLHNLVFRGHLSGVAGALIQNDTLVSWSSDNMLRSWDVLSGKPKHIFEGHSDSITGALIQGNTLISWSYDKTLRSWDILSGKPKQVFEGHRNYVNGVLFQDDVLISWSFGHTLYLWDIVSGKPKKTFEWHIDLINGALLQDNILISWSQDNTLCLWDVLSGKIKMVFRGHSDDVTGALLKDDTLISWSRDKTLRSWDILSPKTKQVFEGHTSSVYGALLYDNVLISWSSDNTLRSWDIPSGKMLQVFEGHLSFVTGALLYGDTLISWSRDGTIRAWDLHSGNQKQIFEGFTSYIEGVILQGDTLIGWSRDKALRSWDILSRLQRRVFEEHTDAVNGALLTGNTLISWSEDKTLRSRNLISDKPKQVFEGHSSFVTGALTEKDTLVSWSSDKTFLSWDIVSGKPKQVFEGLAAAVSGALLYNDILVGWSSDKTLYSWDIDSGKLRQVFDGHSDSVIGALLQKDILFSWSYDKTICSWDITTGKLEHVFEGHSAWVNGAMTVGDMLISWSSDKTLRSWNILSGEPKQVFEGHLDSVIGALVKDDILISWSLDKTLRSWDIVSGEPLKVFAGHSSWVNGALLQGDILISWSFDFTLRSWNIFSGKRLKVFSGHSSWVTGAIWQGDSFVSWSNEELIVKNSLSLKTLLILDTPVSIVKISGAFLYLNDGQNSLYIYHFPSLEQVCRLTVDAQITLVELMPDANRIILGDASGRVHFLEPVGFTV